MNAERVITLAILIMALAACSQGSAPNSTAPTAGVVQATTGAPTAMPASAAQPSAPPLATSAPLPTTAPTVAPPTTAPTVAAATQAPAAPSALSGGDLSEADMAKIFQTSFASYPWRMKETATAKSTNETVTGLVEAQSSTQVHLVSQQMIGSNNVILESILITPTLYMKATGAPAELLKQFGATEGQWLQVPQGSPLQAFAEMAYLAANPSQLLARIGFQDIMKKVGTDPKPYKLVGTEQVGGVQTNAYEVKVGSGDAAVTYHVSVGIGDGRIYKMVSDGSQHSSTIIVEYDPSINIQPPL
jgi:hypothetical protein